MPVEKVPDDRPQGKLKERFSLLTFAQKVAVTTVSGVLSVVILAVLGYQANNVISPDGGSSTTSTPKITFPVISIPSTSTSATTTTATISHHSGCWLMITFPYAKIRASPDLSLQSGTAVPAGEYRTLKNEVVSFGGSEIRWYEIAVHGQRGWVPDFGEEIAEKSGCPVS